MISTLMSLDIQSDEHRRVRLFLPVIILWILALALLVIALPFVLIAALATIGRGPGARLLRFYAVFFEMVFSSAGLRIDVARRGNSKVFIAFN
jgi:hypothetical protein